jgi:hypothetical protein
MICATLAPSLAAFGTIVGNANHINAGHQGFPEE